MYKMDELRRIRLDSQNLEEFVSSIGCIRGQSIFTDPGELPERIVAVGDIHGDLEALFSILLKSGIIDIGGKWIADNTFLVQTGDLFDKGRLKPALQSVGVAPATPGVVPYTVIDKNGIVQTITQGKNNFEFGEVGDELIILKFLCDLHQQATHPDKTFGNSRVLLCTGNHEFMNTSYYEYFSNTPRDEFARLVREGTNSEIQAEITKRRVNGPNGLPLQLHSWSDESDNRSLLSGFTGISNTITHQYAHPMDAVLFGGPDFTIRQEIFRHGSGYLAKKLACILNVVVVVGDFMFSHGGVSPVNLQSINHVSELQRINDLFRDYLMGSPTDPDEIERYFSSQSSILWNRSLGKEYPTTKDDMQVCDNTLELVKTKLKRPNLNIVVGHDVQGTCMDPTADADRSVPRVRFVWDRTNPDSSISKCITLPTVWCKNRIYRIDTAISRMNNAPDFRSPPEGRLNSLIIDLNPDGSKKKVLAMNGILGLHPPIQR